MPPPYDGFTLVSTNVLFLCAFDTRPFSVNVKPIVLHVSLNPVFGDRRVRVPALSCGEALPQDSGTGMQQGRWRRRYWGRWRQEPARYGIFGCGSQRRRQGASGAWLVQVGREHRPSIPARRAGQPRIRPGLRLTIAPKDSPQGVRGYSKRPDEDPPAARLGKHSHRQAHTWMQSHAAPAGAAWSQLAQIRI